MFDWKILEKPYCRGPRLIKEIKPGSHPPPPITATRIIEWLFYLPSTYGTENQKWARKTPHIFWLKGIIPVFGVRLDDVFWEAGFINEIGKHFGK